MNPDDDSSSDEEAEDMKHFRKPYDETPLEQNIQPMERSNRQLSPSSPISKRLKRRIYPTRSLGINKMQRQEQSAQTSTANELHVVTSGNFSCDSGFLNSQNEISPGSLYSFYMMILVSNAI